MPITLPIVNGEWWKVENICLSFSLVLKLGDDIWTEEKHVMRKHARKDRHC